MIWWGALYWGTLKWDPASVFSKLVQLYRTRNPKSGVPVRNDYRVGISGLLLIAECGSALRLEEKIR